MATVDLADFFSLFLLKKSDSDKSSESAKGTESRKSKRPIAAPHSPIEGPASLNILTPAESALSKVDVIPTKSVTFIPNDKRQETYIVIQNKSESPVMFKMKSTRPGVYKMKPPLGVIKPYEKKVSAEKKVKDQKAYMNGYDEGYKAALLESTGSRNKEGGVKELERLQKTGVGKDPSFQEGFIEGYKKAAALLKMTEKKDQKTPSEKTKGAAEKQKESTEIQKESSQVKEKGKLTKEKLKASYKELMQSAQEKLAKPSKETTVTAEKVKAISKEQVRKKMSLKEATKKISTKEIAEAPSKDPMKKPSIEAAKDSRKEPAPKEEIKKELKEAPRKTSEEVKMKLKEVSEMRKEEVKKELKEAPRRPSEEVKVELKEVSKKPEKEVKKKGKEEKIEKETKLSDGTNVTAKTPGGTDPSLGETLKKRDVVHIGPTGKRQIVIIMYRDPKVPENMLSKSGSEGEEDEGDTPVESTRRTPTSTN